jgi:hypothetical protein
VSQTDIGFETAKMLWYIKSFTDNRQFLGAQLVKDAQIRLEDVIVDTYAWAHDKYVDASEGRLRFFDNPCTIEKSGGLADSVLVEGDEDFAFTKLPAGDIEIQFNLPTMDWTLHLNGQEHITRNLVGKVTGGLLHDNPGGVPSRKRFVIEQPESVLYSKDITIINSNLAMI